jgi:[acyl-carrier-protein] S-malonyltransferase
MAPAGRSVAEALTRVELVRPAVPVLANVDAAAKTEPEAIRAALVRQVDSPVQWVKTIEAMRARGVTRIVEIGPGKVLAGLVKRIDKGISMISVADAAGVDRAIEFVKG